LQEILLTWDIPATLSLFKKKPEPVQKALLAYFEVKKKTVFMPGPPVKVRCYVIEEIRSLLTKPAGPRGEKRALGSDSSLFQLPAKKLCSVKPYFRSDDLPGCSV
jgi:hypothetical protein